MSEKLTRIKLPNQRAFTGLMEWGEKSAEEMIIQARKYSEGLRERADAIDAASDCDFQIDIVRGPVVEHHVREVQASAIKKSQQGE